MSARALHRSLPWITFGLLVVSMGVSSPALAQDCLAEIDRTQAEVDAAVAKHAKNAPFAPEGSFATLGHQPTPESVAQAEAGLTQWTGGDVASAALDRARDAVIAGQSGECFAQVRAAREAISSAK